MKTVLPRVAAVGAALLAPMAAHAGWTETVLYSFGSVGAGDPLAGLVLDAAGNLYGTTSGVGERGDEGTVFELAPPANGKTAWTETVLYSFYLSGRGERPAGAMIFDAAGNLYGTTKLGGKYKDGIVFRLAPPAKGATSWTETVLHSFTGKDGANPVAGLVFDSEGNLYGTTSAGGLGSCTGGCGTVFRLAPPADGATAWTETVLHSFYGKDGADPVAGVVFDANGNLYGTTEQGGPSRGTALG
jgi:uncharacterized repeat protein (TIGR03803 family)